MATITIALDLQFELLRLGTSDRVRLNFEFNRNISVNMR